jgi:hypothetical protein
VIAPIIPSITLSIAPESPPSAIAVAASCKLSKHAWTDRAPVHRALMVGGPVVMIWPSG